MAGQAGDRHVFDSTTCKLSGKILIMHTST